MPEISVSPKLFLLLKAIFVYLDPFLSAQ
jgi:hypothetical protein